MTVILVSSMMHLNGALVWKLCVVTVILVSSVMYLNGALVWKFFDFSVIHNDVYPLLIEVRTTTNKQCLCPTMNCVRVACSLFVNTGLVDAQTILLDSTCKLFCYDE